MYETGECGAEFRERREGVALNSSQEAACMDEKNDVGNEFATRGEAVLQGREDVGEGPRGRARKQPAPAMVLASQLSKPIGRASYGARETPEEESSSSKRRRI